MAAFDPCFEKVMQLEGGFTLHEVEGDRGGMTYAGIARKIWPDWPGWMKIDDREFDAELTGMVRTFYREKFWNTMRGDEIESQRVARHIFSFGVNTGRTVSRKLAQHVIGAADDGVFGPKTLGLLNALLLDAKDEEIFVLRYALLKVFRYGDIAYHDRRRKKDRVVSNLKFLIGWINRVKRGIAV